MEEIIKNVVNLWAAIVVGLTSVILLYAYKKEKIDKSAVVGTGIVGFLCLGTGGTQWVVPLVIFFVVGHIASHHKKKLKKKLGIAQTKRTFLNVFSNGGAASLFAFYCLIDNNPAHNQLYFLGLMAAMATAAADTLGTEIGQTSKGKPRSIITLKQVKVGTAGAVSMKGLMSFLLGSVIISGLLLFWGYSMVIFGICVISGFLGAVLDSIFGSTFEQWRWKFFKHYDTHMNNFITTFLGGIIAITAISIFCH